MHIKEYYIQYPFQFNKIFVAKHSDITVTYFSGNIIITKNLIIDCET